MSASGSPIAADRAALKKTLVTLFLSFLSTAALAGMWGSRGISERFVVSGDVLYDADGRGVSVYRIGANVERIDLELTDDRTFDIAVAGSELFAGTSRGVRRYAIAQNGTLNFLEAIEDRGAAERMAADTRWLASAAGPKLLVRERGSGSPILFRELTFDNPVRALAFVGGRLYVGVEREGIYVYDVTRDAPLTSLAVEASGFAQQNNVLWAAAGPVGIVSIDVSSPSAPRILGNSGGGEVNMTGVAVTGTRAFAIQRPSRLFVFDVATPSAPRLLQTIDTPSNVIAASGNRLFLAGSIIDAFGLETATGLPVRVLDTASLATVAEFRDLAGPVSGVATDGSVAYVVDPPFFRVLDVSKTNAPREMASIEVANIQDRIRVKRGLAIVYGRGLVNLIDVTNPHRPKHVGTYDSLGIPPSNAGIARDTIVEANYASGLHVVDTSDPAAPLQIAGRIWHYLDLVTSDDVIYAFLQNTMLVADLTNRHKVVDVIESEIGIVQAELAPAAAPRPDYLLVRTPEGIHVFSLVADRFHPREHGFVRVSNAGVMGTADRIAWFEKGGDLWSIDLPSSFAAEKTNLRVTAPMQISGAGQKVVIADRYSVRVYGPDTPAPQPAPASRRRAVR